MQSAWRCIARTDIPQHHAIRSHPADLFPVMFQGNVAMKPYIVSIDFFTAPTATFRVLYVFLVLDPDNLAPRLQSP